MFVEKALKLLKNGGKLAFIVPSIWLNMHFFEKIRHLLIEHTTLNNVILFRYQVFEDVTAETCIFICTKQEENNNKINISVIDCLEAFNQLKYKQISQLHWKKEYKNCFNLLYSQEKIDILNKIRINTNKLSDIADITVGIKPYQTNKGNPKQTKQDVENRVYDSTEKLDANYESYIVGANIQRYYIIEPQNKYIKYGDWLAEPRKSCNFKNKKIVLRQTSDRIISAVDNKGYYDLNNVHNLLLKENCNIDLNYLTTILNSKIVDFVYKYYVPEAGRVFAEVKIINLAKLPIPNATEEQQNSLSQKAERMIQLNKSLHEETKKAIELIELEYKPKKISQNLTSFLHFGIESVYRRT